MKKSLKLLVMSAIVPAAMWAATINGQIRTGGGAGTPVPNAKVVLIAAGVRTDSTTANGTGNYSLTNVTVGTKQVEASATGFATNTGTANITTAGQVTTLNITLAATGGVGTVLGTVRSAATGNPAINNALVVIRQVTGGTPGPILDSARTNASGVYTIDSISAGTGYQVTASAAGFVNSVNSGLAVTTGGTTTSNLTLVVGAPSGILLGTVRSSATGNPAINNALVVLRLVTGGTPGPVLDSARTNASGVYTMDSVATGTGYQLTASATGFVNGVNTGVAVASGATVTSNFTLTAAPAPATITGVVVSSNVSVIANARVVATRTGGGATVTDSTRTDSTGHYTISNVASGTYSVTVTVAGFTSATNTGVVVATGATVTSNFILTPSAIRSALVAANTSAHFVQMGSRLAVELGVANFARKVEVYGMNGSLKDRVTVPAGASWALLSNNISSSEHLLLKVK